MLSLGVSDCHCNPSEGDNRNWLQVISQRAGQLCENVFSAVEYKIGKDLLCNGQKRWERDTWGKVSQRVRISGSDVNVLAKAPARGSHNKLDQIACPKGTGQPLLTGAKVAAQGFITEVATMARMNITLGLNNTD